MENYPFVTLVMPVRNEGVFIERSLGSVLAQDYPADRMEILVIDGMSTDGTREAIASLQSKHPSIKLVNNPGRIVPTGLNAALRIAAGEIIVRVDGHCEIAADYVRRCVEHLLTGEVDGVGGPLETVGETEMASVIATAMSSPFGVGGSAFRTVKNKTMLADTVAFPAYTRRAVELAGAYDEELVRNQDDEYNYRLRRIGARILLAEDVRSRYYSRSSLGSLWRQYFQYGYWKVRVMQKHPLQMQPRQFAPPLFAAGLFLSAAGSLFSAFALWVFLFTAGSYLVVNLAASVLTGARTRQLHAALPACFAILHLSYGLGFLMGLASFWNRWGDRGIHAALTRINVRTAAEPQETSPVEL
jgi:glycosyltransferase involved in cell wall biosynthesis